MSYTAAMNQFHKAHPNTQLSGHIRQTPDDFKVDEKQAFEASGAGEHVWLHIQKTGENTDWVAGQLANIAQVPRRDVSYAGMKDRHAVTTQWFSVQMPGREAPDWQSALPDSVQVISAKRHDRKLRRGTLLGNQFQIVIRDFQGDKNALADVLARIQKEGVPNYYGEQRFGHMSEAHGYGLNIVKAEQWFKGEFKVKGRQKRSIYLSAARSWLFNHILSERVATGCWNQPMPGDVFMLNGTQSCFSADIDETIQQRMAEQDIHPTGALWGRGRVTSTAAVAELERSIAARFRTLCDGLEKQGLKQERKALRLPVADLSCTWADENTPRLQFALPAGAFATSVLREIGDFKVNS